jgi:hypothetical protein
MAKDEGPRDIAARHAIDEARKGHFAPLAGRVWAGVVLTLEERKIIAAALEQVEGKRGKAQRRRFEKEFVLWRVEELAQGGLPREAAVQQVMNERGRSRGFVFGTLQAAKESKKIK